ncbi:MAG TPA: preprotein translocase subunit YajC [Verrucomicrobiae bacterium]|nr:preprotein translocase subunit YajC [Verrucomicrobiae bacterium]
MSLNGWNIFLAQQAAASGNSAPTVLQFVPFILMFVVLYFIMIRPQSKKAKQVAAMLKTMKPGDKIVTNSGIVGTVVSVKDRTVSIRSADTKLEVLKSAVTEITERSGETSASESQ